TYHAVYLQDGKKMDAVAYKVPPAPAATPAEVVDVWPTGDVLPANHLRFYIQFSRLMRGGEEIFQHIQLLDRDGKAVTDPWLPDELWDETGTQLTLYIHPGRIKWGVLLRLLLGPVLEPDRVYTLVVGEGVLDADGRKLGKEFRKKFKAVAEDRVRLELSPWKLTAPKAGTKDALTLVFPKALDHHSAEQRLKVADAKGQPVAGNVTVSRDGRTWTFQPAAAWAAQEYKVVVDERLEDPCGNTPPRALCRTFSPSSAGRSLTSLPSPEAEPSSSLPRRKPGTRFAPTRKSPPCAAIALPFGIRLAGWSASWKSYRRATKAAGRRCGRSSRNRSISYGTASICSWS